MQLVILKPNYVHTFHWDHFLNLLWEHVSTDRLVYCGNLKRLPAGGSQCQISQLALVLLELKMD